MTTLRLVLTEPGEWRVQQMAEGWAQRFGLPVEIRADTRFFASRARLAAWARCGPVALRCKRAHWLVAAPGGAGMHHLLDAAVLRALGW